MAEGLCPWDVIEVLESQCNDPTFAARWRAFVVACGVLVLPSLPAEARMWSEGAVGFDSGERTATELAAIYHAALDFHRDRVATYSWPMECGLLVVMSGLNVGFEAVGWCEGAWHFLNCCEAAGVPDEGLAELLRRHFADLLPD